jgi:hypothetical protein
LLPAGPLYHADSHFPSSAGSAGKEQMPAAGEGKLDQEVTFQEATEELAELTLPPAQAAGLLDGFPFTLDALDRSIRALTADLPPGGGPALFCWQVACYGLLAAALALLVASRQTTQPAPVPGEEDLP